MKSIVPLYFIPAHEAATGTRPADVSLAGEDPNAVLITEENFDDLCEQGLDDVGRMSMWIMNSEREARVAADTVASQGGSARRAETPLGEGVVVIVDDDVDADVNANVIDLLDKRTGPRADAQVSGSWDHSEKELQEFLKQVEDMPQHRHKVMANAVQAQAERLDAEALQDLQVGLKSIPGAYVGFLSVSVDDFSEYFDVSEFEVTEDNLPELHSIIYRESQKAELSLAREAVTDMVEDRFADEFVSKTPPAP